MHEFQELVDLKSLCLRIGSRENLRLEALKPFKGSYELASRSLTEEDSGNIRLSGKLSCQDVHPLELTRTHYPKQAILEALHCMHGRFDHFAENTRYKGFMHNVYGLQFDLVAYVTEAFEGLGCPLLQLREGDIIPEVPTLPKHSKLVNQLYRVLEEAKLIRAEGVKNCRTAQEIKGHPSNVLYEKLLLDFPQHASEHRLLAYMGSQLADCLAGRSEAVRLMFGSQAKKNLLSEMYANAPAFATCTKVLIDLLRRMLPAKNSSRPLRILEVGAGTGATTNSIIDMLDNHHI